MTRKGIEDSASVIAEARARIEALAQAVYAEDPAAKRAAEAQVASAIRTLARAHLALGLPSSERGVALNNVFWAADLLCSAVAVSCGGLHAEVFFDRKSFAFGACGQSACSTTFAWLDAFYASAWSNRTESFEHQLPFILEAIPSNEEPPALRRYARGLLAIVDGAPEMEGDVFTYMRDAARKLEDAGPEWKRWLTPRLAAWSACDRRDDVDLRTALEAILETPALERDPIDVGIGVHLEASAILVLAQRQMLPIEPFDARLRVPPRTR